MQFKVGLETDFYGVDNTCFKLDNCIFEAVEDESDGYRSCLKDVKMKDDTEGLIFFQTPIARIRVEEDNEYRSYDRNPDEPFDGYKLVDVTDGHVWLSFGTEKNDSYYPSFIFFYETKGQKVLRIFEQ